MPSTSLSTFVLVLLMSTVVLAGQDPQEADPPDANAEAKPSTNPKLGDYVDFPTAGVKVRQPEGYIAEESFEGFGQPAKQASVMALSLPGPYREITAGFTKEQFEKRGWTFLSREEMKVGDMPAVLVHFEQPAGAVDFEKWTFSFGDDQKTVMVIASFPKEHAKEFSELLKAAVLSAQPAAERKVEDEFGLALAVSKKLHRAGQTAGTILYTSNGKIPAETPEDPLFIVGIGDRNVLDTKAFAEERLRAYSHTKDVANVLTKPFSVDGLEGFESTATARDEESDTPLVLYQAIVFNDEGYILMTGLVGAEKREEYLPEFKAMARTLKRNKTRATEAE